jgi:hypothetical protein
MPPHIEILNRIDHTIAELSIYGAHAIGAVLLHGPTYVAASVVLSRRAIPLTNVSREDG